MRGERRQQPLAQVREVPEPMRKWERVAALCAGLVLGAVGCVAVFLSANQAGTTALLLAAAVFLLIGIQGTLLVRVSGGSNAAEFERRLRQETFIERVTKEAEANPERAEAMVESASILEPELIPPVNMALAYDREFSKGLREAATPFEVRRSSDKGVVDFVIDTPHGTILVLVSPSGEINDITAMTFANQTKRTGAVGGLIVYSADSRVTESASRFLLDFSSSTGTPLFATRWTGPSDNKWLAIGFEDLRGQAIRRQVRQSKDRPLRTEDSNDATLEAQG